MNDVTVLHATGGKTLFRAVLEQEDSGCLVRLYPSDEACGMWDLDTDELFLGRGYDCDIALDDGAASRRHAAIQRDSEGYVLVDLNSTNGTFVNNAQVTQHRLTAGDQIRIGSHVFKYLSADHIELQYHETVFKMTTTDGLTGAYNRQYLSEFIERDLARCIDRERPLSVALMDIDFFKQVNDTHGHLAGDEVLREFSQRASSVLRAGDIFARYGGEEFCSVFSECNEEQAAQQAEATRAVIADTTFPTQAGDLPITVSIGVATFNGSGKPTAESMLKAADELLYKAKESGRNRVCSRTI